MGKSCAALGCSNGIAGSKLEDSNISFHKFPLRHPELLAVWTSRTGRRLGAFTPTEHSRLCSRHFLRRDFINPDAPKARRLRDDTIPSVNLPGFPTTDDYVGKESRPDSARAEFVRTLTIDPDVGKAAAGQMPVSKATAVAAAAAAAAAAATLPPSQLRKLAHKQHLGDGADGQMDPVLRETWEVLASDPEFTNSSATGGENDSTLEEKIVRIKPQIWPQGIHQHHHHSQHQQQHHQHHHHHHQQQHQQLTPPTQAQQQSQQAEQQQQNQQQNHHHHHHHHHSNSHPTQQPDQQQTQSEANQQSAQQEIQSVDKDLIEEQEQQLEHEERAFRSTTSSSIGTESFGQGDSNRIKLEMNESLSSHEDYQPPAKKPYQPQMDCSLAPLHVSTVAVSESSGALGHFDCATNASSTTPVSHINTHFDLTGTASRLMNGGVISNDASGYPIHPMTSRGDIHVSRPNHREKNTNPWDNLWSEVGKAVRTVADSFAYFLRTKADIAREQHQLEMEIKGFKHKRHSESKTATKETNTVINLDVQEEPAVQVGEDTKQANQETAESTSPY